MTLKKAPSDFLKNSLIMIFGVGFAQTIPVILQPILRRIYEPEEFGLLAIYFSIVSVLAIMANFRYAQVVVIPEKESDARNVVAGGIFLAFLFSLLLTVIIYFFGENIIRVFQFPEELVKWMFFIPFSVLFVSISLILQNWLTRAKYFKGIAINKTIRRGSESFSQWGLGDAKVKGGLMWGSIFGDFMNLFVHAIQFKRTKGHFKDVNRKQVKEQLIRYKDFPLFNLIPTVLDNLSMFLPIMIINAFFTTAYTGQYDLSRQILGLPLALISIAISQVLLQKLAEQSRNRERIFPLLRNNFIILGSMACVGVFILYFWGVPIFTFVFGEDWELAGQISAFLGISYGLRFMITPLTVSFIAIEKIRLSSAWQLLYFTAVCSLFFLKGLTILEFIQAYVIIDCVAYFIYFLLILFTALHHDAKNVKTNSTDLDENA